MVAIIIYPIINVIYLIFILLVMRSLHLHKMNHHIILAILIVGLLVDSFVISVGASLGEGGLLLGLNILRFYIHVFFTPLACFVGFYQAREQSLELTMKKEYEIGTLVLFFLFVIMGLIQTLGAVFVPEFFDGTLRYVTATSSGPPLGAIGTIFYVLAIGILLARRGSYWILIGAIIMILGASIPTSIYGPLPQSLAEVVFTFGFTMNTFRGPSKPNLVE